MSFITLTSPRAPLFFPSSNSSSSSSSSFYLFLHNNKTLKKPPNLWIFGCVDHDEQKGKKPTRSLLEAATYAAILRSRESLKSDALFYDPYAACITSHERIDSHSNVKRAREYHGFSYEMRTKFIDAKVMELLEKNQVKQVLMVTDGMDTRPYRLPWPSGTVMFDVSPGQVHNIFRERLRAAGVSVPKGCYLQHMSATITDGVCMKDDRWAENLRRLGYRGDRPNIWLMQGIEGLSYQGLQGLLWHASGLIMQNSFFIGEVTFEVLGATTEKAGEELLAKLFLSNGFRVQIVRDEDTHETRMAMELESKPSSSWLLFVAQQQRLSEQQLEVLRKEIELAEEAGDEEGFEDL